MCRFYLTSFLYIALVFTFLFSSSSCKDQGKNNDILNQAVANLEDNPQKAKQLLEAIPNPENMEKAELMCYQLAYIEAKARTDGDIRQDSIILQVRNYYDRQNDIKKGAYAHFYAASYYYKNKQYAKALESYLMADHKAIKSGNLKLAGKSQNNIGYIFFIEGMPDSAIVHFDKALVLYDSSPETKDLQLQSLNSLGLMYFQKKDYEPAIKYYQRGLALAEELDNSSQVAVFSHNIGSIYCSLGELAQSKEYLYKALPITTNKADSVRLYLNLLRVYSKANQLDSVSYYSELVAKNITDVTYKPTLKSIYASLADYNAQIGNHHEAMRYMELRTQINEEILQEQNAIQLLEANTKFALTLKKEALAKQKIWMYSFGVFLLFTLIIVVLVFYHKHQQLGWQLFYKQKKELMLENDLLHQRSVNLSTTLNTYEDILKSRKEIFDDATFEEIEKKKLEAVFNKIRKNPNNSFVEWAKSNLNSHSCYKKIILSLSCEELRIMHLSYLGYPREVVAEMLGFEYDDEDMVYRIRTIKNKLLGAGMRSKEIDAIFTIEDSNSKITVC